MKIQWISAARELMIDSDALGILKIREEIVHLSEGEAIVGGYFITYNDYNYKFLKDREEIITMYPEFERYIKLFF